MCAHVHMHRCTHAHALTRARAHTHLSISGVTGSQDVSVTFVSYSIDVKFENPYKIIRHTSSH
jgi:hypothetical protein